ncbi:MAG: HD domain-containing protein [Dorea sp.]|nr:HD domain-containing protein [Dorea sp.]
MDVRMLLDFMSLAEKLKCNTRHSWTSDGRHESVAEHTCRLCIFAWLVKEEFPQLSMDHVMKLCLFHDLGEAVTGDVPCFEKKDCHREAEDEGIKKAASMLPEKYEKELLEMFRELDENKTEEAKLVHALDKMEAVIQHNEAPIDTWIPLEYDLQLQYGQEQAKAFPYLAELRRAVEEDTRRKILQSGTGQF